MPRIVFGFLFLLCGIANAAVSETAWSKYFAGRPFVPDVRRDVPRLLTNVPKECRSSVEKISSWVDDYGYAAAQSDQRKADRLHKKIQKLLDQSAERGDGCSVVLGRAYAVSSLSLLSPNSRQSERGSHVTHILGLQPDLPITLLGAALANSERLFLDTLDGKVLGAYECSAGTIYLESRLRPMDLASHFVHELDHLFRDKLQTEHVMPPIESHMMLPFLTRLVPNGEARGRELYKKHWNDVTAAPSFFGGLLVDETLAVLTSAFYQTQLKRANVQKGKYVRWWVFEWDGVSPEDVPQPFRLAHDISLFSEGGTLETLQGKLCDSTSLQRFLYDSFLRGPIDAEALSRVAGARTAVDLLKEMDDGSLKEDSLRRLYEIGSEIPAHNACTSSSGEQAQVEAAVGDIYSLIWSSYFPGMPLTEDLRKEVAPEKIDLQFSPLANWLTRMSIPSESEMDQIRSGRDNLTFDNLTVSRAATESQIEKVIGEFETVFPKFDIETRRCREFLEKAGDAGTYLGKDGLPKDPKKPVQPGGGGIRPGGGGIRPGGGGIRPSGPVRLCIDLKEKL